MFFRLSSIELALILFAVVLGATAVGLFASPHFRHHSDTLRDPFSALQAALLGLVGLILAFGLALATRGLIRVPDTALNLRASMELPPAADAPTDP